MKFLIVHEVNYLSKIIYEFQILPEILSIAGHSICIVDYDDTWQKESKRPMFVRGKVRIQDPSGHLIREDTRAALCRCGGSENKPFCDGTHRKIGFRSGPTRST